MNKKRLFYILIAICGLTMSTQAETIDERAFTPNELRIGWGDQLFESLMWNNPATIVTTMPTSWKRTYHENYRYHQHIWLEYQWRFNHWFSLGGMVDMSEVGWDDVTRNGAGTILTTTPNCYFYNLVIMPTIRFTYLHHKHVNLYSGIGFGLDINGGTERNEAKRLTDFGGALNITAIGLSANYDRWFMTVDVGGLTALKSKNTIFMALSRMINVSIGVRF